MIRRRPLKCRRIRGFSRLAAAAPAGVNGTGRRDWPRNLDRFSIKRGHSLLDWLAIPLIVALATAVPASLSAQEVRPSSSRPNLLVILADDHGGGRMGIEGDPRRATPNLDALARQGALFERAFCNSPLCTPSRQSLITGKLPHSIGVTQLATSLSDQHLTLGEWFRDHGYQTVAIGKMHFNGPSSHGFTLRIDTPEWENELRTHPPRGGDHRRPWLPLHVPAREWLNADAQPAGLSNESMQSTYFVDRAIEQFHRAKDRPFAMIVSFYEPHCPFYFPDDWKIRFKTDEFTVPLVSDRDRLEQPAIFAHLPDADIKGIQAAYYTSLSYVDSNVGRLIKALDDARLSSRTLVVYAGDNGYMLGQHGRLEKHCFYEPAVRIPLIIRWPGHIESNHRIGDLVEMIDVMPTLLHLMGVPAPLDLQGINLEPLLASRPGAKGHDVVFSEYLENEEAMVRSSRYKLIVGTGRRIRRDGYIPATPYLMPGSAQRLYDLAADPAETKDLSQDPGHAAVKDELLDRLFERLTTTRKGLEPVPVGLSRLEAIHWCLIPRDRKEVPAERRSPPKSSAAVTP
jgi:arylsulfatase A-like enzyme